MSIENCQNNYKLQEQIIFDRIKKDLAQGSFEISIEFDSLRNKFASIISKEICRLAIAAKKTDDEIIDKINKILKALAKTNQRVYALEYKTPEYVSPPVYGPTKYICPQCGEWVTSDFHSCRGSHITLDNQTQEIK